MNKEQTYDWIAQSLANDEVSSDKELIKYFKKEGKISQAEAEFYIKQRDDASNDMSWQLEKYKG